MTELELAQILHTKAGGKFGTSMDLALTSLETLDPIVFNQTEDDQRQSCIVTMYIAWLVQQN